MTTGAIYLAIIWLTSLSHTLVKYSVLGAMKLICMQRNDPLSNVKIANYRLGQLIWPVTPITLQCIMLGFSGASQM